jgi:hydroxymethylglutaryl-CoA synthase
MLAKNLGNIYTGSLYNGLLSLLQASLSKEEGGEGLDLRGKRIMLFSYGSGCAASMFALRVSNDVRAYQSVMAPFKKRLDSRVRITPEEFDRWMLTREQNFGRCPYVPTVSTLSINPYRVRQSSSLRAPTT